MARASSRQISGGDRQHEAELLRLGAARIVDRSSIRDKERALEAGVCERGD
jgi:hypothetical protein